MSRYDHDTHVSAGEFARRALPDLVGAYAKASEELARGVVAVEGIVKLRPDYAPSAAYLIAARNLAEALDLELRGIIKIEPMAVSRESIIAWGKSRKAEDKFERFGWWHRIANEIVACGQELGAIEFLHVMLAIKCKNLVARDFV